MPKGVYERRKSSASKINSETKSAKKVKTEPQTLPYNLSAQRQTYSKMAILSKNIDSKLNTSNRNSITGTSKDESDKPRRGSRHVSSDEDSRESVNELPHPEILNCKHCKNGFTSQSRLQSHQLKRCKVLFPSNDSEDDSSSTGERKRRRLSVSDRCKIDEHFHTRRASNDLTHHPIGVGEEFICLANDTISFKLAYSASDSLMEFNKFHPSFTHQLFDDEEIHGYKRVEVLMQFASSTLYSHLHFDFDECMPPDKRDNITEILTSKFPKDSITYNISTFQDHVEHVNPLFTPPGHLIHSYEIPSVASSSRDIVTYEVYLGEFKQRHSSF